VDPHYIGQALTAGQLTSAQKNYCVDVRPMAHMFAASSHLAKCHTACLEPRARRWALLC